MAPAEAEDPCKAIRVRLKALLRDCNLRTQHLMRSFGPELQTWLEELDATRRTAHARGDRNPFRSSSMARPTVRKALLRALETAEAPLLLGIKWTWHLWQVHEITQADRVAASNAGWAFQVPDFKELLEDEEPPFDCRWLEMRNASVRIAVCFQIHCSDQGELSLHVRRYQIQSPN